MGIKKYPLTAHLTRLAIRGYSGRSYYLTSFCVPALSTVSLMPLLTFSRSEILFVLILFPKWEALSFRNPILCCPASCTASKLQRVVCLLVFCFLDLLFALRLQDLPVHWYHPFCVYIITQNSCFFKCKFVQSSYNLFGRNAEIS